MPVAVSLSHRDHGDLGANALRAPPGVKIVRPVMGYLENLIINVLGDELLKERFLSCPLRISGRQRIKRPQEIRWTMHWAFLSGGTVRGRIGPQNPPGLRRFLKSDLHRPRAPVSPWRRPPRQRLAISRYVSSVSARYGSATHPTVRDVVLSRTAASISVIPLVWSVSIWVTRI